MRSFTWQSPRSLEEAAGLARNTVAGAMLSAMGTPPGDGVVFKAGGIDLLDLMKEGLLTPARIVSLRELPGLDGIFVEGDGVRIGALATLEQVAANPILHEGYTALANAAGASASPQIRHVATLGGNLLQRPRCWYFRSAAHHCARKGGEHCFAFAGENQYHAVFAHEGCAIVHPSTAATALAALDASVELVDAKGATRVAKLADFLISPQVDVRREADIRPGEILTAVLLPKLPDGARSVFLKQSEKPSFDWPIADVAAVLDLAPDGTCERASVVLGAAAPVPWRAVQAERALLGKKINTTLARAAGEAAILGAEPLRHNAYKLPILATLVRRAVLQAAGVTASEVAR
jgi:xanthine dehydrogenase YagS FAD-binding subunit